MDYKEKIQKLINGEMIDGIRASEIQIGVLKALFPEFTESEDERIRKEIINFLELPHPQFVGKRDHEKWLAWLEKQGESKGKTALEASKEEKVDNQNCVKPTDKVEPKFKVGDWIIHNKNIELANSIMLVIDKDNNAYLCKDINGQCSYNIESIDKDYHLWTIQDAKDGDVLEFGDHGRLVVGIVSYVNKTTGKVDVNCLLENNNFKVGNYYNLDTIKPHPTTIEQRDLLFAKMKEAGYEWDAEKKELKKIEQTSVWSEEDEKNINELIRLMEQLRSKYVSESHCYPSWGKLVDWLKSLRPQSHWKPSEEQMKALNNVIKGVIGGVLNWHSKDRVSLDSLYADLKKL